MAFFHLSFQEFLAAERFGRKLDGTAQFVDTIVERSSSANWRPTLRFLFARRIAERGIEDGGLPLLAKLLSRISPANIRQTTGLASVIVDGLEMLLDRGTVLQPDIREPMIQICLAAINQEIDNRPRFELALMLGRIGDPRVPESLDDPDAWVTVPAGSYIYGPDNQKIRIKQSFELSKFPVTNAQFALFVQDGYQNESLWHPAGWKWRTSNNATQPAHWDKSKWNGATCPVVGVSWWEADAFCRWAGVRLPAEREWEAAARGPKGLVYPWDNKWKDGICNTSETALERTSPVGIFPQSGSFCGAHDMAGNVWEWCVDLYDPTKQKDHNAGRVLCGGSWINDAVNCRSSIRFDDPPDGRSVNVGFRVARTL